MNIHSTEVIKILRRSAIPFQQTHTVRILRDMPVVVIAVILTVSCIPFPFYAHLILSNLQGCLIMFSCLYDEREINNKSIICKSLQMKYPLPLIPTFSVKLKFKSIIAKCWGWLWLILCVISLSYSKPQPILFIWCALWCTIICNSFSLFDLEEKQTLKRTKTKNQNVEYSSNYAHAHTQTCIPYTQCLCAICKWAKNIYSWV